MGTHRKRELRTRLIHPPRHARVATGDIVDPIHMTTTFERAADGGYPGGFHYTRDGNPNCRGLETCLADIEHGKSAAVFASGTAATMAVFQALPAGSHVLAAIDAYHGTLRQLRTLVPRLGIEVEFADAADGAGFADRIRPATRLLWVETPSNPLLKICDIRALASAAERHGALLACDNTFATPVLQNPLRHGANLVVHSATKYLGGHSDVTAGAVITREDDATWQRIRAYQSGAGAILPPCECWLLLRSLRTLACRVEAQSATAQAVAQFLAADPRVRAIYYPGLPDSAGSAIAQRQMASGGAMVSFCVASREAAMEVAAATELFTRATSLGGVESLIEHRASIEGPDTRTPQELLRLSIGLEHRDDLIADLDQALAAAD